MESHEVLRAAFKKVGCKNVAQELKLSLSLIHQWSRPRGGRSDAINPLDRTAELLRLTGDLRPLHWLCEQAGGYFVSNPTAKGPVHGEFLSETGGVMCEMGHLQVEVGNALRKKNVSSETAAKERQLWEELKSDMERYVRECEGGCFRSLRTATASAGQLL
jgi:hypothetical protein